VWETGDPDGRPVSLELGRWLHIAGKHPCLSVSQKVLLAIVAAPDERIAGRDRDQEWFYGRGTGPSSSIRVVVHHEHGKVTISSSDKTVG
jgi:hypothetical protein